MRISELSEARVGLLGMGAEGQSVLRALRRAGHTGTVVALGDSRGAVDDPALRWRHGQHQRQGVDEVDVVVRSPGFPLHHPTLRYIQARGVPMTTATNLFFAEARAAGLSILGITGSKGKSTTASLAQLALRAAGHDAVLVGNIGAPALDRLEAVQAARAPVVFELSSYQCHDLTLGPSDAALLDLFPEHMDWHGSIDAYYQAKLSIARTQRPGDRFVYNLQSRIWGAAPLGPADAVAVNHPGGLHFAGGWFCQGEARLFSDATMRIRGTHQRRNAVSALALTAPHGVTPAHMEAVLAAFGGLPHRNEDLGVVGGVRWYDDAISTAPEAAVAALQALHGEVHTLIVGGMDRGYDFQPLADALRESSARVVLLIPDSGAHLAPLLHAHTHLHVEAVDSLEVAVDRAAALTPAGTACLFSPASPSYNRFSSFIERGRLFQALVRAREG